MNLNYVANVRPSHRQLQWQETEFYGFIHFGMNTVTDREWGLGDEPASRFNPPSVDVDQWVQALKSAGMRGVILTAKHHDGFCLWPSQQTDYTVASSPWLDGQGDLVRDISAAAARHGLKLGLYLSPWDRHEPSYGSGKAYDDYYVAQLIELLTSYGPLFSVWLDGANGEGPNGKVQHYDWEHYYGVIRALQPDAVINVCGPDVRWCGNEAGDTRPNEWSVVPASLRDAEGTASKSQTVDDGEFSRLVRSDEDDLGSRAALADADKLCWYPAEVNTSIRPGWFYHAEEDTQVRTPAELFEIYCGSVGGNATFLLNVPPTPEGLVAAPDLESLRGFGELVSAFRGRRVDAAQVQVSSGPQTWADAPWRPSPSDDNPTITLRFDAPVSIEALVVGEDIAQGQRIEHLRVDAWVDQGWRHLGTAESVGYQRILRFPALETERIRITISEYRQFPTVKTLYAVATAN